MSGVFRAVIPLMRKSTVAAGQELLKSGVNLVQDVWKTGDLKKAKNKRGKELITNVSSRVADHMFGSGYSGISGVRRTQLKAKGGTKKTGKASMKKSTKQKAQKKKNVKSKAKTVKKKKKKTPSRSKQNIQDLFT